MKFFSETDSDDSRTHEVIICDPSGRSRTVFIREGSAFPRLAWIRVYWRTAIVRRRAYRPIRVSRGSLRMQFGQRTLTLIGRLPIDDETIANVFTQLVIFAREDLETATSNRRERLRVYFCFQLNVASSLTRLGWDAMRRISGFEHVVGLFRTRG